eukprot:5008743-Pyramimonas_sp.AAC.2
MWALPLGPSVELLGGHEACDGRTEMEGEAACGRFGRAPDGETKRVRGLPKRGWNPCGLCHWGLQWSSLWGHEPCKRCTDVA